MKSPLSAQHMPASSQVNCSVRSGSSRQRRASLVALLLVAVCAPLAQAQEATGRWEDIASFTAFNPRNLPLEKLAKEQVVGKTLSSPGSIYGVSVETLALGRLSPEDLVNSYLAGNRSLVPVSLPPSMEDFSVLQLRENNPADARFIEDTYPGGGKILNRLNRWQLAPFQKGAAQKTGLAEAASRAWREVLFSGAEPFQRGGLLQVPALAEPRIQAGREMEAIFKSRPAVSQRFAAAIQYALTGRFPESKSHLQLSRWRKSNRDGRTRLSLTTLIFEPRGQGLKFSEVEWMGSSDEFARVTLTELWPVSYGGKPASVIWRGDYILTSVVAGRRGAQRLAVEMYHLKHIRNEMKEELARFAK